MNAQASVFEFEEQQATHMASKYPPIRYKVKKKKVT